MARIAQEAERQGFQVGQTRTGMWKFRKGGNTYMFGAVTFDDVLDVLKVLISAGLDWSAED